MLTRLSFLHIAAGSLLLPFVPQPAARAAEQEISKETILNDPDAPTAGNADGDITIVDFFDYNCPFCKKSAPALERLVQTDGKIRLVYKDWPILAESSMYGAHLALGAKYQGKYLVAHRALMDIPGYGISREAMLTAVGNAGVDLKKLEADVGAHSAAILNLLKRNLAVADAVGLQGTPGFLIGPFKVNQALTYEGFERAVADARAQREHR